MATPSNKTKRIWEQLDKVNTLLRTDRKQVSVRDCIEQDVCSRCDVPCVPNTFKDQLSITEYTQGGLCQTCQDTMYAALDEAEQDLMDQTTNDQEPTTW